MHSSHGLQSPGDRKDLRCPDRARFIWEDCLFIPGSPNSQQCHHGIWPHHTSQAYSCSLPVNGLAPPVMALPLPSTPTGLAYSLRETNDWASAERGACPAHKPRGWVMSGVAMAATTHPSVFSPFCLRADQPSRLSEPLERQGVTSHLCPLQVHAH